MSSASKIIVNLIGTYFEYFDFMLFAFCVPIFLQIFAIPGSKTLSLLLIWSAFAISFLVRPLGSVLFGLIGDLFGRALALSISTILMSIPTIIIGLIPPYSIIGKWSLILLISCRILQGFAVSGEYTGSIVNIYEGATKNRGLLCSLTGTACALGVFSGSLLLTIFHSFDSLTQNQYWWRWTFITAGFLVGFSGLVMRFVTQAKPIGKNSFASAAAIVKNLYSQEKIILLSVLLLSSFVSVLSYIIFAFLPNQLQKIFGIGVGLQYSTFCIFFAIIMTPVAGLLADKYEKEKVMMLVAGIAMIFFPFLNYSLTINNSYFIVIMYMLFSGLTGAFGGALCTYLVESFQATTRYTGSAVAYNLAICAVGPVTPLILTVLWPKQFVLNMMFMGLTAIVLFFLYLSIIRLQQFPLKAREDCFIK